MNQYFEKAAKVLSPVLTVLKLIAQSSVKAAIAAFKSVREDYKNAGTAYQEARAKSIKASGSTPEYDRYTEANEDGTLKYHKEEQKPSEESDVKNT